MPETDSAPAADREQDPGIVHADLHSEGGPGEEVYRLPVEFDVHGPKRQEIDAKAARRAERQVAGLFGIAALATLAFCVAYLAIKLGESDDNVSRVQLSTILLGVFLGLALFCIGAGVIHWAKTLMAEDEYVQERHPLAVVRRRTAGRRRQLARRRRRERVRCAARFFAAH